MGRIIRESKNEQFNKFIISSITSSVIMAIAGAIMLFLPNLTNKLIGIIVGIMILISGVNSLYKYFKRDGAKLYSFNLIFGIILGILGIVIILSPSSVTAFVTVCFGLYLIVMGANKITYGSWLKVGNDASWLITMVIGGLLILFGILLIFNPFSALTLTKLVGTFMLLAAILDITNAVLLKNRSKDITNIFW